MRRALVILALAGLLLGTLGGAALAERPHPKCPPKETRHSRVLPPGEVSHPLGFHHGER